MLARATILNFQRLREFDLDLTTAPAHLIAGSNEAGKSSLADAIRFGLTGEANRVELKRDYPGLVTRGAKVGTVALTFDNGRIVTRLVRDGKLADESDAPPEVDADVLAIVLGTKRFHDLDASARRRLLMRLTGAKATPEVICERLTKRGIPDDIVARVKPMLRTGFDAVVKVAAEQQSEARGAWRATTGEAYGDQKAATWRSPDTSTESIDALRATYDAAATKRAEIEAQVNPTIEARTKWHRSHAGAVATLAAAERSLTTTPKPSKPKGKRIDLAPLEAETTKTQNIYYGAEQELLALSGRDSTVRCPHCSKPLRVVGNTIQGAAPPTREAVEIAKKRKHDAANDRDAAKAELEKARAHNAALDDFEKGQAAHIKAVADVDAARAALAAIEAAPAPDVVDLEAKLAAAKDAEQATADRLDKAERARTTTDAAAAAHRAVTLWGQVRDACGPDGIPAELVNETIGPVNTFLSDSARVFNEPDVPRIDANMNLSRGDDPYALLSESAKWRLDAMFAAMVALKTDAGLLILDRVDVLDNDGRSRFVDWVSSFVAGGIPLRVIALGTFRQPPALDGLNIAVHWLEAGALSSPARAA